MKAQTVAFRVVVVVVEGAAGLWIFFKSEPSWLRSVVNLDFGVRMKKLIEAVAVAFKVVVVVFEGATVVVQRSSGYSGIRKSCNGVQRGIGGGSHRDRCSSAIGLWWSSDQVKCWRHYFKRMTKIEVFKGSTGKDYWLPLCWRSVADVVPTLRSGDKFRFRLEWNKSATKDLMFGSKSSPTMKGMNSETICYMEDAPSANESIIQSTSVADPCKLYNQPTFTGIRARFVRAWPTLVGHNQPIFQSLNLTENQKKKLEELRQKDANALSIIQRGITKSIFPRIIRAIKAKEAWDILKVEYHGDDKVRAINLQTLRRDFKNMKMKENETLAEFFTKFMDIINQMKSHGEEISNGRIVEKVLISLHEKFDPKVAIIDKTKDISKLGVPELMASLKSYEQRLARHSEKSIESTFQSKLIVGSSKNDERKFQNLGQNRKHTFGGKGNNSKGKDKTRRTVERRQNDDGASQKCNICKRGSHNSLSVRQLLERGYKLDFEGNGCVIYDNGQPRQLVKKIRMESNRSFPFTLKYVKDVAMKAHIVEDSWLWHERFGHLNFQGLKLLFQKKLVQGLPTIEDKHGICEGCTLGKHHRRPFMKEVAWIAKGKLDMANTSGSQPAYVPEFDGEDYDFWFVKMKTIFRSMGLWDLVENGFTEPESTKNLTENQKKELEEVRQKDANALSIIQRGVTKSIFPRIIRATKAKEAWDILKVEYHGDDKVRAINLQTLRRDFKNMKMKENETLAEFFTKFMDLINQMKSHGEEISNGRIVEKVLINLPEKFDPKVAIIGVVMSMNDLAIGE
ncbi:hypothetical protein RJ639_003347 [Escallonia herrerae]|uniref:GAG-pre-integrase domain-containing protein n=1 Tax=Escallonia herrerae TaxID=1293975 RepID=A0AA89AWT6_9ASTE|nr:hypothetical protein RJ639_003347 [Escallonia herrerae]